MSTLFVFLALPVLSLFVHVNVDSQGRCLEEPGSYRALLCPKPTVDVDVGGQRWHVKVYVAPRERP